MTDFLKAVQERVVIYDGAMGTNIRKRNPTLDDYWSKQNCSEVLVLSRPDIIERFTPIFCRSVATLSKPTPSADRELFSGNSILGIGFTKSM